MKKIKILYMIDWLYDFGGSEKHLYQLTKYLNHDKFQCYLIAINYEAVFIKKYFSKNGCVFIPFNLNKIYGLNALKAAYKIVRFIHKEKIDIVQTFGMGADNYGSLIARISGVPLIISSRRDMGTYRKRLYRIADRFTSRFIDQYLAVCDRVGETVKAIGVPDSKISRIYNGIDFVEWDNGAIKPVEVRKKMGIDCDSFVIGNISHFRREKGYHVFFEAIKRVANEIPKLRVFALGGKGDVYYSVLDSIKNDPLLREIVVIKQVQEIREYLSIFDIACLTPVSNEGFSNALLEEMAAGLCVIATDVGGNAEAIINGESGIVIPPNDVDALVNAILKLYHQPALRKVMSENARQRVYKHFTIEKMIENYENYYYNKIQSVKRANE